MKRTSLRIALLCAAGASWMGCGDEAAPLPSNDAGPQPFTVDTLAPARLVAGAPLEVRCSVLDAAGADYPVLSEASIRSRPHGALVFASDGTMTIEEAGVVELTCAYPDLYLADPIPALVEVVPSEEVQVRSGIDVHVIEAGGSVEVSCSVFDGFGNPIEDASPSLRVLPESAGTNIDGPRASFTEAGEYTITCHLEDAEGSPHQVQVRPARPSSLRIARMPDQPLYGHGETIELHAAVSDRFGNGIEDAPVHFESAPAASLLRAGQVQFDRDGTYTITGRVDGPTESGEPLEASMELVVDGLGPAIGCDSPRDGAMIVSGEETIVFEGHVTDVAGVNSVTVNGEASTLTDGTFRVTVPAEFGINIVEIQAEDATGKTSSQTCSFLASPEYVSSTDFVDTVAVDLGLETFNVSTSGFSLGTAADRVAGNGLEDMLEDRFRSPSSWFPQQCIQTSPFGCTSVLGIDYLHNSVHLQPMYSQVQINEDNISVRLGFREISFDLRLHPHEDRDTLSTTTLSISFNIRILPHSTKIFFRAPTPWDPAPISLGPLEHSADLSAAVTRRTMSTARTRLTDALRNAFEHSIAYRYTKTLEAAFETLRIWNQEPRWNPRRPDGDGLIPLDFAHRRSQVEQADGRLSIGFGTRISGAPNVGYPTAGVAVPTASPRPMPAMPTPIHFGTHLTFFNQALHALWRGGFLEATFTGDAVDASIPEDVRIELRGALPPVVREQDESLEIGFGALMAELTYPGVADEPIQVVLGGRASASQRSGPDVEFHSPVLSDFAFSSTDPLAPEAEEAIEEVLRALLVKLAQETLGALPALPMPSFRLPSGLNPEGTPGSQNYGGRFVNVELEGMHLVGSANFQRL